MMVVATSSPHWCNYSASQAGTHPNVVSLMGVSSGPGSPCLLLEFAPHGTLDRFLWSLKKGPVPQWYLKHVREALQDLSYHRHVAYDLMRISLQVADGMVGTAQNSVRFLPESYVE